MISVFRYTRNGGDTTPGSKGADV